MPLSYQIAISPYKQGIAHLNLSLQFKLPPDQQIPQGRIFSFGSVILKAVLKIQPVSTLWNEKTDWNWLETGSNIPLRENLSWIASVSEAEVPEIGIFSPQSGAKFHHTAKKMTEPQVLFSVYLYDFFFNQYFPKFVSFCADF